MIQDNFKENKEGEKIEGILPLDIFQTESEIVIKSAIAGISGNDLDISVEKEKVIIKGVRKNEDIKLENYYHREIPWGPFSRVVILPEEIDADKAKATLKNGILTITLPKISKIKKLEVI